MFGKFSVPMNKVSGVWKFMKKQQDYTYHRDVAKAYEHFLPSRNYDSVNYTHSDHFRGATLRIKYDPKENRIYFELRIKEYWENNGIDNSSGLKIHPVYSFTWTEIRTCYIEL